MPTSYGSDNGHSGRCTPSVASSFVVNMLLGELCVSVNTSNALVEFNSYVTKALPLENQVTATGQLVSKCQVAIPECQQM